jgi:curved DNA-binding protein
METPKAERRKRARGKRDGSKVKLTRELKPGVADTLTVDLVDISEWGCCVETTQMIACPATVSVVGPLFQTAESREGRVRARTTWCRKQTSGKFRVGLAFQEEPQGKGPSSPAGETASPDAADYYELLQLSPSADLETIHRVYRLLAQRFHPDNPDTGDIAHFRLISDAYSVLSNPESRASYDATHKAIRAHRWKIFDQSSSAVGIEGEKRKRQGILGLLYVQRMQNPQQPSLGLFELEDLLGCPKEHLEFSLWFLKEQGWVARTDNGRCAITAQGVNEAERGDAPWLNPARLLTSGASQSEKGARSTAA